MNEPLATFTAEYDYTGHGKFCVFYCGERFGSGHCFPGGYIHSVRVEPLYQGYGYGKWLMAETVLSLIARGYSHITLDVAKDNLRAQHVYESIGFVPLKTARESYFAIDMIYIGDESYARHVRAVTKASLPARLPQAVVHGERVLVVGL